MAEVVTTGIDGHQDAPYGPTHIPDPNELPLVLVGPILRSVTGGRANVWLATSRKMNAPELQISSTESGQLTFSTSDPCGKVELQLGERLFIYLLWAGIPNGSRQRRLHYDIKETTGSSILTGLDLGIRGDSLPSFTTHPETLRDLHFCHASCRIPQGGSTVDRGGHVEDVKGLDMLARLEGILQDKNKQPPSMLLLTGDQIYADDVAATTLDRIINLKQLIFGSNYFSSDEALFDGLPGPGRRQSWMMSKRLTSGAAANHLVTFQEYALAYILAWSPVLWPDQISLFEWLATSGGDLNDEDYSDTRHLVSFVATLHLARRAMANIATYMIFDDHEVTDDWNMDSIWRDGIWNDRQRGGRRIIINGCLAYATFQHLGNTPIEFDADFPLLRALVTRRDQDATDSDDRTLIQDNGWLGDAPGEGSFGDGHVPFHYKLTGRDFEILAFDVRTWRQTDRSTHDAGVADLALPHVVIGPRGFERQWSDLAPASNKTLIAVLPPPWIGFAVQDLVQRMVWTLRLEKSRMILPTKIPEGTQLFAYRYADLFDNPSISKKSRDRVLLRLANHLSQHPGKPLIILSGDVHYSYFSTGELSKRLQSGGAWGPVRIHQLVSSSLANRIGLTTGLEAAVAWQMLPATFRHALGVDQREARLMDALRRLKDVLGGDTQGSRTNSPARWPDGISLTDLAELWPILEWIKTGESTQWLFRLSLIEQFADPKSPLNLLLEDATGQTSGESLALFGYSSVERVTVDGEEYELNMAPLDATTGLPSEERIQALVKGLQIIWDLLQASLPLLEDASALGRDPTTLPLLFFERGSSLVAGSTSQALNRLGGSLAKLNDWVWSMSNGILYGRHNISEVYLKELQGKTRLVQETHLDPSAHGGKLYSFVWSAVLA